MDILLTIDIGLAFFILGMVGVAAYFQYKKKKLKPTVVHAND